MYTVIVAYEWDPRKALANRQKHGVLFAEATGVFDDDFAITVQDDMSDIDEVRFATIGLGTKGRVLVVVFCYRSENIRIISARLANTQESEQYEVKR